MNLVKPSLMLLSCYFFKTRGVRHETSLINI